MSVSQFLKNTGWVALAAAMVATALPASAQDRRGDRDSAEQAQRGEEQGGDRRDFARQRQAQQGGQEARQRGQQAQQRAQQAQQRAQQAQQRAAQPAQQAEQRAARPVRQAEPRAAQPARQAGSQGNWQNRQVERGAAQDAQAAARQGDWQRGRQAQQVQQRPVQEERRADRRGTQVQPQGRNTTYTARSRDNDRRDNNTWRNDGRRDNNTWHNDGRRDNNTWRDNDRRDSNTWRNNDRRETSQRWDRRWRDNSRYDWQRYRNTNRTTFRIGIYYSPYRNYSYRRMGIGYYLDSLFFGSRYWINDPWQYRLPQVYGPYRWVRYYDDVLLVDIYTGEVVDVIYDFFW